MHLKRAWNQFFFTQFDPSTLGVFRIIFGLFILITFIALFPNWETYYGPTGFQPGVNSLTQWSVFYQSNGLIPIQAFWWIGVIASLLFILGLFTRISTLLLFILHSSMSFTNSLMINGEDLIIRMLLFYGIFAPLGASFSLDLRFSSRPFSRPLIWPLRLMQINIALIYAFSLPVKLLSDQSWTNGEAIYWVMMSSTWSRWPIHSIFYHDWVSKILTYSTVIVEGTFPLLVWFKSTRSFAIIAITIFHIGLAILLKNVSFFSVIMACAFIIFIPSEYINSAFNKLTRKKSSNFIAERHLRKSVCK